MFNTESWNYDGVEFIEFYGLRKSGNIEVIEWLMSNMSDSNLPVDVLIAPNPETGFMVSRCGNIYHLNDVGSLWGVGHPEYISGLIDAYVSMGAKKIIISYRDYDHNVSLTHTFPENSTFHKLKGCRQIILLRDIVNLLPIRYAAQLNSNDLKLFDIDINKINSWIVSAISENTIKIRHEDLKSSREYQTEICVTLGINNTTKFNSLESIDDIKVPKHWSDLLHELPVIRARRKAGFIKPKKTAELIKAIGDSHTSIFDAYTGSDYIFEQTRVHGATARGAINPKTKTDSLRIFKEGLSGTIANRVIIGLGEVDCGYIIWYKNKHDGISLEDGIKQSMDGLFTFVKQEVEKIYQPSQIILMASIPPTIEDNTDPRFLEGRRSDVNPTLKQRADLTRDWNRLLEKRCKDEGYRCMNINNYIIDSNDRVKNTYRNNNPWDHHLLEHAALPIILDIL